MRIRYNRYKESELATFISGLGAFLMAFGISAFIALVAMLSEGECDSGALAFTGIAIGSILVGALCKHKFAEDIAYRALNKKYEEMVRKNEEIVKKIRPERIKDGVLYFHCPECGETVSDMIDCPKCGNYAWKVDPSFREAIEEIKNYPATFDIKKVG